MHLKEPFERFKEELHSLAPDQSKLIDFRSGPKRSIIRVFPGASVEEIVAVENSLRVILPKSFKQFLLNWDGAVLYETEPVPGIKTFGAKVFGTKELVEKNRMWREYDLSPEERENVLGFVIFADWQDGNYYTFDTSRLNSKGECPILDGFHEMFPWEWKVICSSFNEWLIRIIEANGRAFWWS